MTQTRPSRSRASGAPARAPRLSALHLVPDSLGFALDGAAQAVDAVDRGAALPAALAAVHAALPSNAQAASRGAIQDIGYRAMRRRGTADWLIAQLVAKAPPA
ncbi:ribosomal RNA small subunit methyltransferase B, partial [Burkholderia pseudomallei 406e]